MKALFVRRSGAGYLLAGLLLLSATTLALEVNTRLLEPLRTQLASALVPLFVLAQAPYLAGGELGDVFATREMLLERNAAQAEEILALSRMAQQYEGLKAENDRLRALLGSRARVASRVLVAELIGVVPHPETRQIILDKGSAHGVVQDAPVIDARGLFGRVTEVGAYTSRVLLLTDATHAVPVQLNRNGVRSIAAGTGEPFLLELENIPITTDVHEGDLVETSGLGGGFPPGFPVGRVSSVRIEPTAAFAMVGVTPLAELDRARHLLVLLDVAAPTASIEPQP
ncbi:MAG: rod shape-determining protein MreC [Pseudomonadales bacterium]|jgi:rod shape-determining protein MreC